MLEYIDGNANEQVFFLVVFAGSEALNRFDVIVKTGKGFSSMKGDLMLTVFGRNDMKRETVFLADQMLKPGSILNGQLESDCAVEDMNKVELRFIRKDPSSLSKSIVIRNIQLVPMYIQDVTLRQQNTLIFTSTRTGEILLQHGEKHLFTVKKIGIEVNDDLA